MKIVKCKECEKEGKFSFSTDFNRILCPMCNRKLRGFKVEEQ